MMGFLVLCFLVGLFVVMLFTSKGRDILKKIFLTLGGVVGVTLVGALVIGGLLWLLLVVFD